MTEQEFRDSIVGTQYVNRGYFYDGCDCWGLCYLYYRDVVGCVPTLSEEYLGYEDFTIAFTKQLEEWVEIPEPEKDACVFVCFNGETPTHCGIMLNKTDVLHSFGNPKTNEGQVAVWKLHAMRRYLKAYYGECKVKYYKWRS